MTWAAASGLTRVRARACVMSAAPAMASGPGTVRSPPPDVLAGAVRDVLPAWLPAGGLTTRCHNAARVHAILQRPPPELRPVWLEQRRTYSRRGSRPKDRPRTVGLGVPVKERAVSQRQAARSRNGIAAVGRVIGVGDGYRRMPPVHSA